MKIVSQIMETDDGQWLWIYSVVCLSPCYLGKISDSRRWKKSFVDQWVSRSSSPRGVNLCNWMNVRPDDITCSPRLEKTSSACGGNPNRQLRHKRAKFTERNVGVTLKMQTKHFNNFCPTHRKNLSIHPSSRTDWALTKLWEKWCVQNKATGSGIFKAEVHPNLRNE